MLPATSPLAKWQWNKCLFCTKSWPQEAGTGRTTEDEPLPSSFIVQLCVRPHVTSRLSPTSGASTVLFSHLTLAYWACCTAEKRGQIRALPPPLQPVSLPLYLHSLVSRHNLRGWKLLPLHPQPTHTPEPHFCQLILWSNIGRAEKADNKQAGVCECVCDMFSVRCVWELVFVCQSTLAFK